VTLASQDALRINVLLANKPQAIRIHESSMTLYGLSDKGELKVELNPDCRDEQYIKKVKEMLSGYVLGSPGGYPVYLQRWTRMGQMRDDNLEQLLLLGEPEAVIALACASGLSDELARRAWWVQEDADNARRMLISEAVKQGVMGPVLAAYLVEYLPFESESEQMMMTVALVLQPGLIDAGMKADLWKKSQRKNPYLVGFLSSCADAIPDQLPPSPHYLQLKSALEDEQENAVAQLLLRVMSPPGQAFIATAIKVLGKPTTQEMVTTTLDVLAGYFSAMRPDGRVDETLDKLEQDADDYIKNGPDEVQAVMRKCRDCEQLLYSMRLLSGMSYGAIRPFLGDSTAIGSLMRRKLEPVMMPLLQHLKSLQHG
jgi:hypothetical protein